MGSINTLEYEDDALECPICCSAAHCSSTTLLVGCLGLGLMLGYQQHQLASIKRGLRVGGALQCNQVSGALDLAAAASGQDCISAVGIYIMSL